MKFYYLTDESEKTLSPFFSSKMLIGTFNSVLIIGALFVAFWPWQDFIEFITGHRIPPLFFAIFTATLVINSYINLRCGAGEMSKRVITYAWQRKEIVTFEKENDFLQYGLVESVLHTLFLFLPFFPLLILSTAISGISSTTFARAVSIVLTASLLCRLFGFFMYLLWGRSRFFGFFGYILTRVFLIGFIFLTTVFAPTISPIYIIYRFNKSLQSIGLSLMDSYFFYLSTVSGAIVLLIIMNQILIKRHIHKESGIET